MSRSLAILKRVGMIKAQYDEDQERRNILQERMKFMATNIHPKGSALGTIFNAQSNATTTQANAANNYGALYGTGYVTVTSTAASQGYYHLANQGLSVNGTYQTQPAVYIPSPSGQMVSVQFVDATGLQQNLLVDGAYASLLQQIAAQHQYHYCGITAGAVGTAPHQKMLEGDFSPEEMEKAAQVIEEMGGDLAELH